jgi:hypothetical protein
MCGIRSFSFSDERIARNIVITRGGTAARPRNLVASHSSANDFEGRRPEEWSDLGMLERGVETS